MDDPCDPWEREITKGKPVDRWLATASAAVGVALYLLPKTSGVVAGCLVLIFGLLVHPIWNFWWIENNRWAQVGVCVLLIGGLVVLGRASWPGTQSAESQLSPEIMFVKQLRRYLPRAPIVKPQQEPTRHIAKDGERRSASTPSLKGAIRIRSLRISQFSTGKPIAIKMTWENQNPSTIPVKLAYCVTQKPESITLDLHTRQAAQEELWADCMRRLQTARDALKLINYSVPSGVGYEMEIDSNPIALTDTSMAALLGGSYAMYLYGTITNAVAGGTIQEFCLLVEGSADQVHYCYGHN